MPLALSLRAAKTPVSDEEDQLLTRMHRGQCPPATPPFSFRTAQH